MNFETELRAYISSALNETFRDEFDNTQEEFLRQKLDDMLRAQSKEIERDQEYIKQERLEESYAKGEIMHGHAVDKLAVKVFREILKDPIMTMNVRTYMMDKDIMLSEEVRNVFKKSEYIQKVVDIRMEDYGYKDQQDSIKSTKYIKEIEGVTYSVQYKNDEESEEECGTYKY